MTFETDAVIIGAGIIGLACAAALARRGREVVVLEAASVIGAGISSRNSEVIHAGMYYPVGSLKQRFCVEGRRRLYRYVHERSIAHRPCGKLIVATSASEDEEIEAIAQRGAQNGVEGLKRLSAQQAHALEPDLHCTSALLSAETGIVDSHGLMLALRGEVEDHGGALALKTPFMRAEPRGAAMEIEAAGAVFRARALINAAGLAAQDVAQSVTSFPPTRIPPLFLAKGNYFRCTGRPRFSRLIYPAPVDGGLGVHLTLDLAGGMRFGPDVEWLETRDPATVDYTVDPARGEVFYAAIRRYWPSLPDGALAPDYAGLRPKLSGKGAPAADFRIDGPADHGCASQVHLFGIESPGLTSALAIAEHVADLLKAAE